MESQLLSRSIPVMRQVCLSKRSNAQPARRHCTYVVQHMIGNENHSLLDFNGSSSYYQDNQIQARIKVNYQLSLVI